MQSVDGERWLNELVVWSLSIEQEQAKEDLLSQFQVADIKGDPNFWNNLIGDDKEDSEEETISKQILPPRRCTVKSYSEASLDAADDDEAQANKKRKRANASKVRDPTYAVVTGSSSSSSSSSSSLAHTERCLV
jgi:hypothetical protein